MKIIQISKIIFLVVLVVGCLSTPQSVGVSELDLSSALELKDTLKLSSIAWEIEYIILETNENSSFKALYQLEKQIKFTDSLIIISDRNRLFAFKRDGVFLYQIGSRGRGPGEHFGISDIALSESNDTLFVQSTGLNKLLIYDINGGYLHGFKTPFNPYGVFCFNDKLVFYTLRGWRNHSDYYALTITDMAGVVHKRMIDRSSERVSMKGEPPGLVGDAKLYSMNGKLYYFETGYDTLYEISADFDILNRTAISFGKDMFPLDQYKPSVLENIGLETLQKYIRWSYYLDLEMFMFFEGMNKESRFRVVYEKTQKKGYTPEFLDNYSQKQNAILNDLDHTIPFWPHGTINDHTLFRLLYGYQLQTLLSKVSEGDQGYDNSQALIQWLAEDPKNLESPVLIMVSLKRH